MNRTKLTEAFHGEGDARAPSGDGAGARGDEPARADHAGFFPADNLSSRGNELLTVAVKGGKLTILTRDGESDDEAIKQSRFVSGELQLENGKIYAFWLSDERRGTISETAVYDANTPQTG